MQLLNYYKEAELLINTDAVDNTTILRIIIIYFASSRFTLHTGLRRFVKGWVRCA